MATAAPQSPESPTSHRLIVPYNRAIPSTVLPKKDLEAIAGEACQQRETMRMAVLNTTIREATLNDKERAPIIAVINTADIDRYQSIVDPTGGDFDNYLENPIVLWQHGLDFSGSWPVGRTLQLDKGTKEVEAHVEFDMEGSLGAELDRLYRQKWLRGFSVGFIPISYEIELLDGVHILRYTAWELAELSAVAVPGNAKALARAMQGGEVMLSTADLKSYLERTMDKLDVQVDKPAPAKPRNGKPAAVGKLREALAAAKPGVAENRGLTLAMSDLTPSELDDLCDYLNGDMSLPGDDTGRAAPPATATTDPKSPSDDEADEEVGGGPANKPGAQKKPVPANTRAQFPIEWNAAWRLADEMAAAGGNFEVMRAMAAHTQLSQEGSVRFMLVHHHCDGRLSWRGLAEAMARLLCEPINLDAAEKDAIYRHLAEHYEQLGIAAPDPGAKTPDAAYELAVEGRIALVDAADYAWLYDDAEEVEGRKAPRFARCDEPATLRVGHFPPVGRCTDPRMWGKRSVGRPPRDESLLEDLATTQRALKELLESRKGAEFSTKNKAKVRDMAKQMEGHADELHSRASSMKEMAGSMRGMIEDQKDDTSKGASGHENRGDRGPAGSAASSSQVGTGFKRPL